MKNNRLLFLLILGINFSLNAQKLEKRDVFNVSKISVFLKDFSDDQTQKTSTAIAVRTKGLKEARSKVEKKKVNKNYYTKLIDILTETQKQKVFGSFVNKDVVKNQTEAERNNFKDFPIEYQNSALDKLLEFNYQVQFIKNKYPFNLEQQSIEKSEILSKKRQFLRLEKAKIKNVTKVVRKIASVCIGLSEEKQNVLRDYHFYVLQDKNKYDEEINRLLKNEIFVNAKRQITDCVVLRKMEQNLITEEDSLIQEKIKDLFSNKFTEEINKAIEDRNVLPLDMSDKKSIRVMCKKVIKKEKQNSKKEKKKEEKELFIAKAKKVGLSDDKIKKVLFLIEEKTAAVNAYKVSRSNKSDDLFSLTEVKEVKKAGVIKKEFAEKLSNTLSYKEFALLIGSDFKKKSTAQTTQEIDVLVGDRELSKEETKNLQKHVFKYFYNQNITKAYYSYDKHLLKQKLGILTYRFEKEYEVLAKELKLNVDATKKTNNRTFQWN